MHPSDDLARRVAARLASDFDPNLSPPSGISEQQRDRVYEAVVDEILLQDRGE